MVRELQKKQLLKGEFWQNNWLVAMVVLLVLLNLAMTIMVIYQVRQVNSPVPIRFTGLPV